VRQDQLKKEDQKCDHGYFFGATCEMCALEWLTLRNRSLMNASVELYRASMEVGNDGTLMTKKQWHRFVDAHARVQRALHRLGKDLP
jgi:hypothetical protein